MALCLFCNRTEKNYRPGSEVDFTCGTCVQILLGASREERIKAHQKAIAHGYLSKAKAIEMFLPRENDDEQRKPEKHRRHTDRKRIDRTIGNKKDRIGRSKTISEAAVL